MIIIYKHVQNALISFNFNTTNTTMVSSEQNIMPLEYSDKESIATQSIERDRRFQN